MTDCPLRNFLKTFPLSYGINAYLLLILALTLILDCTVDKSKKRIIRTDSDVCAGMDLSATLSYKDIAGQN